MRILVLTQYYPPDLSACAFRMEALVRELCLRHHDVTVLTGIPNRYASYEVSSERGASLFGEKVLRLRRFKQNGGGLLQRSLGDFQYFAQVAWFLLRRRYSWDVVFATSPHLFIGLLGRLAGYMSHIPFVLDIRDLWPGVMVDLGYLKEQSFTYRFLRTLEGKTYAAAKDIIINSPAFQEEIELFDSSLSSKIQVVTNGIDDHFGAELQKNTPSSKALSYPPYTILYAGNLGVAQHLETLLKKAHFFRGRFNFVFLGDGSGRKNLEKFVKEHALDNVFFYPPCSRENLPERYARADAFFVHLKNIPMFTKTIPSKIFEYCITGKPVIYGLAGMAKGIMEQLQGNRFAFTPGNEEELSAVLEDLYSGLSQGGLSFAEGQEQVRRSYLRSELSRNMANIIEQSAEKHQKAAGL